MTFLKEEISCLKTKVSSLEEKIKNLESEELIISKAWSLGSDLLTMATAEEKHSNEQWDFIHTADILCKKAESKDVEGLTDFFQRLSRNNSPIQKYM